MIAFSNQGCRIGILLKLYVLLPPGIDLPSPGWVLWILGSVGQITEFNEIPMTFPYPQKSSSCCPETSKDLQISSKDAREALLEADQNYLEKKLLEQELLQKPLLEVDPGNPSKTSSRGRSRTATRSLFSRQVHEILRKPPLEGDPRNPPEASSRGRFRKSSTSLFSRQFQGILQKHSLEADYPHASMKQ